MTGRTDVPEPDVPEPDVPEPDVPEGTNGPGGAIEPNLPEVTGGADVPCVPDVPGGVAEEAGDAGISVGAVSLHQLLGFLSDSRGIDFTQYKTGTTMRRLAKRMAEVHVETYEEYVDYLEMHPDEYEGLCDTMLINVTRFFRDPEAWDTLAADVVPAIVGAKRPDEPIRAWSAGCSSGEEAYSLAILFSDVLGEEAVRRRVKIYATDVDEPALAQARLGAYSAKQLDGVSAEQSERYFEPTGGRFTFRPDLRRSVIFGRHDLTADAPISRLDLLVCRNTLMYLNAEAQTAVLARFGYALNPDGYLFLGRAEMLLSHQRFFTPFDLKARIFRKASSGTSPVVDRPLPGNLLTARRELSELAFDASPTAQIVVSVDSSVVAVNDRARIMFGINERDVGRFLQDLEISYRPVELRSRIEQAYSERRLIVARSVERQFPDGQVQYLDVTVMPLPVDGAYLGVSVTFEDVTRYGQLQLELKRSREELDTAYEELQSANEELETSNEELQSANEELETSNEELQSANEELETMNEELQAANDELEAANEQERSWAAEANRVTTFVQGILASVPGAVVVVNRSGVVDMWNAGAEALWGVRPEEARGRQLFELDFGLLPAPALEEAVADVLAGGSTDCNLELQAVDRRGGRVTVSVRCTALAGEGEVPGVLVVMETQPGGAVATEPAAATTR